MTNEQIETEIKHLATREELAKLGERIQVQLSDLKGQFGDFKVDLIKTIWLTQLSTIGIILIGVGLLVHFRV